MINGVGTARERLDAGELVWVTNYSIDQGLLGPSTTDEGTQNTGYTLQHKTNMSLVQGAKTKYGEEAVVISNAFDSETETASGVKGMLGIYVTAEAYKAAQEADPASS